MLTLYDELPHGRYAGKKLVEVIDRNPYYVQDKLHKGELQLAHCARTQLKYSLADWLEYEEFWQGKYET